MIRVRYFAAAAEAAGTRSEHLPAATLGELRQAMIDSHGAPLDRVLSRCSLLVNGARTSDPSTELSPEDHVDVLPPFAGG